MLPSADTATSIPTSTRTSCWEARSPARGRVRSDGQRHDAETTRRAARLRDLLQVPDIHRADRYGDGQQQPQPPAPQQGERAAQRETDAEHAGEGADGRLAGQGAEPRLACQPGQLDQPGCCQETADLAGQQRDERAGDTHPVLGRGEDQQAQHGNGQVAAQAGAHRLALSGVHQ